MGGAGAAAQLKLADGEHFGPLQVLATPVLAAYERAITVTSCPRAVALLAIR